MDEEERIQKFIQKQVERAAAEGGSTDKTVEYTEFKRDNEEEKVTIKFGSGSSKSGTDEAGPSSATASSSSAAAAVKPKPFPQSSALLSGGDKKKDGSRKKEKRKTALDEIMEEEAKKKSKIQQTHRDYWLTEGIVVKITTKRLGEKFYKKKGVVKEVIDKYEAKIKMIDTGAKVKVDQIHVETVIPGIGKPLLIVNGPYRGCNGCLEELNDTKFSVTVKIESGPLRGKIVDGIPYEDISKLASKDS